MARTAFGAAAAMAWISASGTAVDPQHRVCENLAQFDLEIALLVAGEGFEIDIENFGQLEQQIGGDAALVVLDQVQIAGGDPELLRKCLLAETLSGSQAAQSRADDGF